MLFSRVPDYFEGEFVKGKVSIAKFSEEEHEPVLIVNYPVEKEILTYESRNWLLKSYTAGQQVTMIYNPNNPHEAAIYSFVGYWIKWSELIFTACFFVALFMGAKYITGTGVEAAEQIPEVRKRKYKD